MIALFSDTPRHRHSTAAMGLDLSSLQYQRIQHWLTALDWSVDSKVITSYFSNNNNTVNFYIQDFKK